MKRKTKQISQWYSLDNIINKCPDAAYYMVYGERSNGKTYSVLEYGLKEYLKSGKEMAIIRRWKEDFRGKRGKTMFANLEFNGKGENKIAEYTGGRYTTVVYQSGAWYLAYYDKEQDKNITAPSPFCYAFALSDSEHDKSTSYPKVDTILFDEFIPKGAIYLPDEYVTYMMTLSTIIRHRDTVRIFMCANSLDKYALYFKEFGLKHNPQWAFWKWCVGIMFVGWIFAISLFICLDF